MLTIRVKSGRVFCTYAKIDLSLLSVVQVGQLSALSLFICYDICSILYTYDLLLAL